MTAFDDYEKRLAGLPEENFIGQVIWYSINGNVSVTDMEQLFLLHNIPAEYLPKPIAPADAFRKATNLQDGYRYDYEAPWNGDGHTVRILIREVSVENGRIEKHIVREHVNPNGKTLDYDKVGEAVFTRPPRKGRKIVAGGEKVDFSLNQNVLRPEEIPLLTGMVQQVRERYNHFCLYLDGNAVRKVIRDYVTNENAVSVKPSGGVYFVHKERRAAIDRIQRFVLALNNGSTFHTLPLVDTAEQRDMLSDAFQSEVESDVESLLKDIAELNDRYKAGDVPSAKYSDLFDRYQQVMTRSEEYTRVLGSSQERAATALDMAMTAVWELASRVVPEGGAAA